MALIRSKLFGFLSCLILSLAFPVEADNETDSGADEPKWTLILLVFIISSALAALFGIASLVRKSHLELPTFSRPVILDTESNVAISVLPETEDPVMTTYRQFPLDYGQESYPMGQIRPVQETDPYQRHVQHQPIMVTTQRM